MVEDSGRVPGGTGLSQAEPQERLGPAGFDPSRGLTVGGHFLNARVLRPAVEAMKPGKGIDYFEAWDVTWPLLPACKRRGLNASYVAGRLLQWARKEGFIRHRGSGQWVRCDSDGSPLGDRPRSGLDGEAATARAEGIAHNEYPTPKGRDGGE